MPSPDKVNPAAYKVIDVIYNHHDFAVAYGKWTDTNTNEIAMRWNDSADGKGYPKVFAHPQWFLISREIAPNLLQGLLSNSNVTATEYQKILDVLKVF